MFDPKEAQAEPANQEAIAEQVAAVESAQQDQATGASDSEEVTEG